MAELETINVGMVGHIDHGKTTLLHKLSGKWTDTHSAELKRGITIKLGYADTIIYKDKNGYNRSKNGEPVRHVSFVDAPGHEMLMATMLSGAAMIDAAILVVAANEGIKPQTIEHVAALQAKKVKNLIVAQNKIDLVSAEQAKKNYLEIKELLKGKFDDAPIIPVSAQQEVNLDKLYEAIVNIKLPERNENATPIFIVARSFDINRPGSKPSDLHGAVLGGTLKQGKLKIGDEIEIKPGRVSKEANQIRYNTLKTKIVKLFKGSGEVSELVPGGSMSIETELDMTLGKADLLLGNVASLKGNLPDMTTSLSVKCSLFPEVFGVGGHLKAEQIKLSEMLMFSVNTSMTVGVVKKMKNNVIDVSLKIPIIPFKGDNVGIARNINNHWRLIGYGEIV
ncbi:MAG TPA: translation initiation factor IF-2 subunit gamma [Candidatus Nanoarchaeia archaeon]|nr:translation initiation factor IF-2 subunit gamma [Candidatus Nanoarchaeia archaeon]